MALILKILIFILALGSVHAFGDTFTVETIDADASRNIVLKKVDQKVGNRLRAVVIDREGHEQRIFITGDDALEIKRGLWVIRPGVYQIEI